MKNRFTLPLTGVLLMIGSGLALTHNLALRYDVIFGDEMTYMASGLTYTFPPNPKLAQWGTLYSAWLWLLYRVTNNTLDMFYLNWRLLVIMTGALLFLYLYLRRSGFVISLFCALCFQFSSLNVELDPRISTFTLCVVLGGLCVIQARNWSARTILLITALTALICAYIRPEFYISMLIAFWWAVGMLFIPKFRRKKRLGFLGLLVLAVELQLLFGYPLSGGNRSFDAFVQHFSINYNTWHNQPTNIPIVEQFKLVEDVFGHDVKSVRDAFWAHPDLFIRHLWTNTVNTVKAELHILGGVFIETPWENLGFPHRKWVVSALLAVIVLGLIDLPGTFRTLRAKRLRLSSTQVALLILLFPSLVSVILIYPRIHYLYFHAIGLITGIAYILKNIKLRVVPSPVWSASLSGLMVIWIIYQSIQLQKKIAPTPIADNIRFIRSLLIKGTVSSLERDWYRIFLYSKEQNPRWVRVEYYQPNTDFVRFMQEQNINFILMTRDMRQYFANDTGFMAFLANYKRNGFLRLEAPERGSYLLIRPELLAKK